LKAIKKLSGETAIYGVPSIVGRFLNWWLTPYWSHVFINQSEMGSIINVYAYAAFLFVMLTYGMETGYFRYASQKKNPADVFSSAMISLFFTTLSFVIVVFSFRNELSGAIDLANHPEYISIMAVTLAFDVMTTLPFAQLRLQHRPVRFAVLKFVNIGVNIFFNILFLSFFPYVQNHQPDSILLNLYNPEFGIGYVFLSNLIASFVLLLCLIPQMKVRWILDWPLLKKMLAYSFPIFIVGVTGQINQNIDKILLPKLLDPSQEPMKQLGIYGTAFKMAVLLNMFIQAFRFAFEPFFFSQKNDIDTKKVYALIMKYFSILGLIIFLGISTFTDLIMKIVASQYRDAAGVVPIILMANFFMGIYFTLSLWYKVTDKTKFGAYFGILGSVVTILLNVLLIPVMGYYGSAIAILLCFVLMTVFSYSLSLKHYPVPYDLKSFFFYLFSSIFLFALFWFVFRGNGIWQYGWALLFNLIFWGLIFLREKQEFSSLFLQKDKKPL